WDSYLDVKYGIKIKNITLDGDVADVDLIETSYAILPDSSKMEGELKSESISKYKLRKDKNGKWKVFADYVLDETTTMMYGEAKDLDIKLTVPTSIEADKEYTASLEFNPPAGTMAIASIASDVVEYPQQKAKEVFRALPDDGILERLFTSNSENKNEYIIASIGLTKSEVCDISIKLSLTGYGYMIRRVNVIPKQEQPVEEDKNAENK
ncbi:MAG: hypothetical protein MJ231_06890, partial [bacterium]|nr:hypothetical protein [bacterium]